MTPDVRRNPRSSEPLGFDDLGFLRTSSEPLGFDEHASGLPRVRIRLTLSKCYYHVVKHTGQGIISIEALLDKSTEKVGVESGVESAPEIGSYISEF